MLHSMSTRGCSRAKTKKADDKAPAEITQQALVLFNDRMALSNCRYCTAATPHLSAQPYILYYKLYAVSKPHSNK